jgi:hypothetical protein
MYLYMAIFRKKARNLPKFLLKNSNIIDIQLEMWQILPKTIQKFLWTMLLNPKFFHKMAKIHHQKNHCYKVFLM